MSNTEREFGINLVAGAFYDLDAEDQGVTLRGLIAEGAILDTDFEPAHVDDSQAAHRAEEEGQ